MSTFFIGLILFFAILNVKATCHPKCGANEKYEECGTSCEPTCENPHPTICTKNCQIGCQCLPGYLRNEEGKCVVPEDCKFGPRRWNHWDQSGEWRDRAGRHGRPWHRHHGRHKLRDYYWLF